MVIIDVVGAEGAEGAIAAAADRESLVYAIARTPDLAQSLRAADRPNLHLWDWSAAPHATLETALAEQAVVEVDLLRLGLPCLDLLRGAGAYLHSIRRIHIVPNALPEELSAAAGVAMETLGEADLAAAIAYLEAAGFRRVSPVGNSTTPVEVVRISRYAQNQNGAAVFAVSLPHVGQIVTPQSDLVGRLLQQHAFEGPEQAFLWLYLRPGDTFLDCGAHAGVFSCIAARQLQNQGQILAFEPNPSNLALYRQNLDSLGCTCFTALPVGLSDRVGEATFYLGKAGLSAYGTFAAGAVAHAEIGCESLVVPQVPLDQVITEQGIGTVALAKLDVEGWEVPVVQGAAQAIAGGQLPLWMVEFTEANAVAAGSSTAALAQTLESFGYTLCRFDATRLRLVPETKRPSYAYANLFAVADLEAVNGRLAKASEAAKAVARDIVDRWDMACRLQEVEMLLGVYDRDRADRLEALTRCEQDRADRLDAIQWLSSQVHELTDRVAEYETFDGIIRVLRKARTVTDKLRGKSASPP